MLRKPEIEKFKRAHSEEWARRLAVYDLAMEQWFAGRMSVPVPTRPSYPAHPPELVGLTCGAMNRRGAPCRSSQIFANGRCKFHGGLSTGPKSAAGKAAALANLSKRWPSVD